MKKFVRKFFNQKEKPLTQQHIEHLKWKEVFKNQCRLSEKPKKFRSQSKKKKKERYRNGSSKASLFVQV
jgi:uncharacterized membrane protein